jgi:nicotinate-nucleotide adenylyltransferase
MMVAGVPWQKVGVRALSAPEHRLAMTELAIAGLDGIEACTIELERTGNTYTVDTLRELHDRYPGAALFLIVGGDAAAGLSTWKDPHLVAELSRLVVVARPPMIEATPPPGWDHDIVEAPLVDLSSSEIRERLRRGQPVTFLTPDTVAVYARAHGLYGVSS